MFNHLHLHSSGSELDGAIKVDELVDKVIEQGCNAVAVTDHGSMVKTYELYKTCKAKGIKPIMGCEVYCGEKDDKEYYHLVLLAKNNTGFKNLCKLVHKSYDLFYYKPRISLAMLEEHREGLIVLSACLGGEVAKKYNVTPEDTIRYIEYMKKLFGDDYYLEIQPNAMEEQVIYNKWIEKVKDKIGVQCVITCDSHYLNEEDHNAHDTLLCMQVGKKKTDTKRMRFPTRDAFVQDEWTVRGKLYYLTTQTVNEGINNTVKIADKCNVTIEYKDLMPKLPGVVDEEKELQRLCNEGYKRRLEQGAYKGIDTKTVLERIRYEVSVLKEKGFCGYFLIVHDFVKWCKDNGIPTGLGRGSVCGSEIPFLLGITEVEPIKYGLFFERFLNPTRNSAVDIDQDICYEKRHLLINYIKDKYGANNISHIIAEGSLTVKAVVRKVMSVYGYEMKVIGYYTKLIDDNVKTLKEAIDNCEELRDYLVGKEMYNDMLRLEGLMSHASMHAAGLLIMNDEVDNHFPVRINRKENVSVCEWNKKIVESLGG